jgi:hypothetical protein
MDKVKLFFLFCLCGLVTTISYSQTGQVTVHDHAGANKLIERHQYFNKEHREIPGWRIQIFSTSSLTDAKAEKSSSLRTMDHPTTIIFEAPNYKVRIGNYRNRLDAYRDLQQILIYYPNAFICKDLINVQEL